MGNADRGIHSRHDNDISRHACFICKIKSSMCRLKTQDGQPKVPKANVVNGNLINMDAQLKLGQFQYLLMDSITDSMEPPTTQKSLSFSPSLPLPRQEARL